MGQSGVWKKGTKDSRNSEHGSQLADERLFDSCPAGDSRIGGDDG